MVTENMGFGVGFCQSTAPHPSPPTLSASPCGNVWKTVFERVWWPLLRPCPRCVHSTSARRANKKIVVRRRCRQTPLQTSVEVGWQPAPEPRHAQQRASRSNRKRQQPTLDTSGPPNMKTAARPCEKSQPWWWWSGVDDSVPGGSAVARALHVHDQSEE